MNRFRKLLQPILNQRGAVIMTYDDGNRLSDVMRLVVNISPTETPFMSGIGKTKATNTLHEWPMDSLAAADSENKVIEGATHTYGIVTAPTRVNNVTQIFKKTFHVSSTERWVKGAGVDDMFTYQEQKALKEVGRDIELALLRGSKATGNASVARSMAGAINFVTTNATAVNSGDKLTESLFNGILELVWTGYGTNPDEVYVGARLKRVISGFSAGSTKYKDVTNDKRMVNVVDVYESDFGVLKIFKHRDFASTANACELLAITNDKFKMAIGDPIHLLDNVPQDTAGTKGVILGELTLEVLSEQACGKITGVNNTFN